MVEVTVALQGNKTLAEYRELGLLIESLGFDGASVYADLGFQPAIVPLLELARATKRIRLGPAALNTHLLHPVEIAGQIAMLDHASNGRAYLGLVRGAWLNALGIEDQSGIARMREAVTVIRYLLAGNTTGFQGQHFSLPAMELLHYPRLRPSVPLLLGGWGSALLALAGEVADEIKIGGSANPRLVSEIERRLQIGGERICRPPGAPGIVFGAVTVVDDDGVAARALACRELARYLPVVAPLDPTVDIPATLLQQMALLVDAGDLDSAANLVPDDILDRFAFSGTPEQIVRQVAALFDAGVSRVEFGTPHGLRDAAGIRLLGQRVLPAFRSQGRL